MHLTCTDKYFQLNSNNTFGTPINRNTAGQKDNQLNILDKNFKLGKMNLACSKNSSGKSVSKFFKNSSNQKNKSVFDLVKLNQKALETENNEINSDSQQKSQNLHSNMSNQNNDKMFQPQVKKESRLKITKSPSFPKLTLINENRKELNSISFELSPTSKKRSSRKTASLNYNTFKSLNNSKQANFIINKVENQYSIFDLNKDNSKINPKRIPNYINHDHKVYSNIQTEQTEIQSKKLFNMRLIPRKKKSMSLKNISIASQTEVPNQDSKHKVFTDIYELSRMQKYSNFNQHKVYFLSLFAN